MRKIIWIFLALANIILLNWLVIPFGEITLYGTSPLAKIYFYSCSFLLGLIFFYLNFVLIEKYLDSLYFNFVYFFSNLLLSVLMFYNYSETIDIQKFTLLVISSFIISSLLFYLTYSLVKAIIPKWKRNYFVILLPIVFLNPKECGTYWIPVASLFLYFMFQVISSVNKKKDSIPTSHAF